MDKKDCLHVHKICATLIKLIDYSAIQHLARWLSVDLSCNTNMMQLSHAHWVDVIIIVQILYCELEGYSQSLRLAKKVIIHRKSTFLIQFSWYFTNITYPWGNYFDQVSKDKNCGFFVYSQILAQLQILGIPLYLCN